MLELKNGDEILAVVGGITTIAGAQKVFADNLDAEAGRREKRRRHALIGRVVLSHEDPQQPT